MSDKEYEEEAVKTAETCLRRAMPKMERSTCYSLDQQNLS